MIRPGATSRRRVTECSRILKSVASPNAILSPRCSRNPFMHSDRTGIQGASCYLKQPLRLCYAKSRCYHPDYLHRRVTGAEEGNGIIWRRGARPARRDVTEADRRRLESVMMGMGAPVGGKRAPGTYRRCTLSCSVSWSWSCRGGKLLPCLLSSIVIHGTLERLRPRRTLVNGGLSFWIILACTDASSRAPPWRSSARRAEQAESALREQLLFEAVQARSKQAHSGY
jgi:hypothetical protein